AVAFPALGAGMEVDVIDRAALELEGTACPIDAGNERARRLAVLGRAVRGLEMRIADRETGAPLGDRGVGELQLRGVSITPGYYRNDDATAAAFVDGWFRTGDLAYLADEGLVVCGRLKDVIIVGGRNVFPEDVERAAASADGVRAGNVIAFGATSRRHKESIVVVAETKAEDPSAVRERLVTQVSDAVGIPPADVVLVRPGTLPKTSSGKLQRSLCRERYEADALDPI
ncbi:MAG: fatty-acid--CoA ligase, partial [Acidimicrobiia bacterium]